ncbi:MAG TPA: low affinity iron permease family protein [Bryobacteraceae bacterium]|nr:low affinity iron permease family protein [Bryobacteraceae bacterium]
MFPAFAHRAADAVGSPWTFVVAVAVTLGWAATGPVFHFSDTWQLVINTATTIITFLMVFLIQNTQNRDSRALHLKLDELIRAHESARNRLVDLEECTDEELNTLKEQFRRLRGWPTGDEQEGGQEGSQVQGRGVGDGPVSQ